MQPGKTGSEYSIYDLGSTWKDIVRIGRALSVAPIRSASAAPTPPVALFGEVRSRFEWDRPGGPLKSDAFTYLRSRFGVRVDAAPGTRILMQVQDSRVRGAEAGISAPALGISADGRLVPR